MIIYNELTMTSWNQENNATLSKWIGEGIRSSRIRQELSQKELAELSGVSTPSLSRIERGSGNTSLSSILLILKAPKMADQLKSIFDISRDSPAMLAKHSKNKTKRRVRKSTTPEESRTAEKNAATTWTWGEDKK